MPRVVAIMADLKTAPYMLSVDVVLVDIGG
jgi:hypothetical protein